MRIDGLENINESLSTHYLVYKITNNVNGKYYVGQHKTSDYNDSYAGSGTLITKAESKYGLSAFTKTIMFDFDNFDDMNNKEAELVQLSNCYPYDPMSYNLTPGGNGGNKFASKTEAEMTEIFNRVMATKNNKSDNEKIAINQKIGLASKNRFLNMTDDERYEFCQKLSEIYWSKSEDERNEIKMKISISVSKAINQMPEEKKKEKIQKWLDNYNAKPDCEKERLNQNNRSKALQRFAGHSHEENAVICNQKKRKETLANKSDKEKRNSIEKQKQSMRNRTSEQKLESRKKYNQTVANRSPEKAKQISEMRRLNATGEKGSMFGKKGKDNPNFGKKRMYNPNNPSERYNVKPSEFKKFLSKGFKFSDKKFIYPI